MKRGKNQVITHILELDRKVSVRSSCCFEVLSVVEVGKGDPRTLSEQ